MGLFGWLFGDKKKQAEETPQETLPTNEAVQEAAWAEFAHTPETKPMSKLEAEPTAMPDGNAPKTTELLLMKLKARYPKGSKLSTWSKWTEKLRNDQEYELHDLFLKAFNVCKDEQDMTLEEYLEQNGMMLRIWPGDYDTLYKLIDRYKGNPFCGNAKEFRDANKDINWASIKRIADARASGFPGLYLESYTPIFKRDEPIETPEQLIPGHRKKFYAFLEKMKEAFPDKQIELQPGVYNEWSEGIREFCYEMHYPNIKAFLAAYGFTLAGADEDDTPQNGNVETDAAPTADALAPVSDVGTEKDSSVLYRPGQEPAALRKRLDTLFAKLDEAYPDKQIVRLQAEHKQWAETITELYRKLGYESNDAFLAAYGYTLVRGKGGRPTKDLGTGDKLLDTLKQRYPDGAKATTVAEISEQNPDLAAALKTAMNSAPKKLGMKYSDYLRKNGLLLDKSSTDPQNQLDNLVARYKAAPFVGTVEELKAQNPDLKWTAILKVKRGKEPIAYINEQNGHASHSNTSAAEVKMGPLMYTDGANHFYNAKDGRARFITIPLLFDPAVVKRNNNANLTNTYKISRLTRKSDILGSIQAGDSLSLVREAFAKGGFSTIAVYTYQGQRLGVIEDDELAYYIDTEYVDVTSVKAVQVNQSNSQIETKRVRNSSLMATATYNVGGEQKFASFKVAGTNYYIEGIDTLENGCELTFKREPNNPYSENAIAVFGPTGEVVGHVPEVFASEWSPLIDNGDITDLRGTADEVKKAGIKTVDEGHPAGLKVEIVFSYDDKLIIASNMEKDLVIELPHSKLRIEGGYDAEMKSQGFATLVACYKDSVGDIMLELADREFFKKGDYNHPHLKENEYCVDLNLDKDVCNMFKRERLISVSEEAKHNAKLYRIECNDMLDMMREQMMYVQCYCRDKLMIDCIDYNEMSMVDLPDSETPYIAQNLNWYLLSIGKRPVSVPFAVPKTAAVTSEPQAVEEDEQEAPKTVPANKPKAKKRTAPTTITGTPVKINDDFSILVPNGMRWSTNAAENDGRLLVFIKEQRNKYYNDSVGEDWADYDCFMPFGAPQCLTLTKGVEFSEVLGRDADFSDSNIHNLVLKMADEVVGKTLTDDFNADVVFVRDDEQIVSSYMRCKDNNTMFLIATPKAVYQGQIFINDTEDVDERHELIESWLGSIRCGADDISATKLTNAFALPTYQHEQSVALGEMSLPVPDEMIVWHDVGSQQNLSKLEKEQLGDAALVMVPKDFDKGFGGYKDAPFSVRFSRSGIQQVNGADSLWLLPENMRQKYLTNILDQNLQSMDVIQDYKIKFKELEPELDVVYSQVGEGPDWCSYVVCFLCKNTFYQAMMYINNATKDKVTFRKAVEQWIFGVALI